MDIIHGIKGLLILLSSILHLSLFFSCTDGLKLWNEEVAVNNNVFGDKIAFSLMLSVESRTAYSDDEQLQMHWSDEDHIRIYTKDAYIGTRFPTNTDYTIDSKGNIIFTYEYLTDILNGVGAIDQSYLDYEVNIDNQDNDVILLRLWNATNQDLHMRWKGQINEDNKIEEIEHTFYGVYPQEQIALDLNPEEEQAIITMNYITNQKVIVNNLQEIETGLTNSYHILPDMKNAYLLAKNSMKPSDANKAFLCFEPIMTTLDISLSASGRVDPINITGVSVIMPNCIEKDNELQFRIAGASSVDNTRIELMGYRKGEVSANYSQSVNISFVDRDNKAVALPMHSDLKLSLLSFLPPFPAEITQGTKIKVHTLEGYNLVVTLTKDVHVIENMTSAELGLLCPQSRITIRLPNLSGLEEHFNDTPNTWMNEINHSLSLQGLTLPGVVCDYKDADEAKSLLTASLYRGVRSFDMSALAFNVLKQCLDDISSFLESYKSEFILIYLDTLEDKSSEFINLIEEWQNEWKYDKEEIETISNLMSKGIVIIKEENKNLSYCDTLSNTHCEKMQFTHLHGLELNDAFCKLSDDSHIQKDCCYGIVFLPIVDDKIVDALIQCNFKYH